MRATVFYLLMLQKYINSKQKTQKFTINNIKKIGLKRVVKFFSVDFNPIDTNDILDIHKLLMRRT